MPGNDFMKNPAGSAPAGRGINFLTDPNGSGPTAPTPTNFVASGNETQKNGVAVDRSTESEVKDHGGPGLRPAADVPASRKDLTGAGSIGNARKPFKGILRGPNRHQRDDTWRACPGRRGIPAGDFYDHACD